MFTQLVEQHEVSGETAAATTRCRRDLVPLARVEAQCLLPIGAVDMLDELSKLRDALGDLDRTRPLLLGDVERLRCADDERCPLGVHAPQGEHLHQRRLTVLAGDEQQDGLETVGAVRVQFERADEQRALPRQKFDLEDLLGELDAGESLRRLRGELAQRRRADARFGAPDSAAE